jgi:hypothetical protein
MYSQWLAQHKTFQAAEFGQQGGQPGKIGLFTPLVYVFFVLPVILVIDERSQKDAIPLGQVFQEVVGTNLISLVRRIRYTVTEEKKCWFHVLSQR